MVRSALALSLLGLSAVNALPAQPVEERQTWIIGPPGEPSFGGGGLRPCDAENPGACFYPPITGGLNPSPKDKRDTITFEPIEQSGPSLQCSQAKVIQQILRPLLAKENPNKYEKDSIIRFTDILRTCGFSIADDGASLTKLTPRSEEAPLEARQEFRIGCGPWEVSRLIDQYNYLRWLYGINTERWPQDAKIQRQTILNALESCNQGIQTGPITPQPTVPGGPLVPEPVIPGGPIVPQPVIPGGPITPDPTTPGGSLKPPKKRDVDVEAAQEALQVIEDNYGTFDQGKIPAFIAFAAEGIIADLRNSGIVVIGWPKTTIGVSP
ncbi:hypothetical protein OQA88_10865 [Cercophora sp. LCS_1]